MYKKNGVISTYVSPMDFYSLFVRSRLEHNGINHPSYSLEDPSIWSHSRVYVTLPLHNSQHYP